MRIAFAALAAVVASCTPAAAQMPRPCVNPADIAAGLAERFREAPVARAVDAHGGLVTVYSNPDTGTWTLIVFLPARGCAFEAASGEGWGGIDYVPPAPGRPS